MHGVTRVGLGVRACMRCGTAGSSSTRENKDTRWGPLVSGWGEVDCRCGSGASDAYRFGSGGWAAAVAHWWVVAAS